MPSVTCVGLYATAVRTLPLSRMPHLMFCQKVPDRAANRSSRCFCPFQNGSSTQLPSLKIDLLSRFRSSVMQQTEELGIFKTSLADRHRWPWNLALGGLTAARVLLRGRGFSSSFACDSGFTCAFCLHTCTRCQLSSSWLRVAAVEFDLGRKLGLREDRLLLWRGDGSTLGRHPGEEGALFVSEGMSEPRVLTSCCLSQPREVR